MALVEYHWIMTLTGSVGPGGKQATVGTHGLVTRDLSITPRHQICNELIELLKQETLKNTGQLLNDANIIFFQLESNKPS